jgi:hypothetical protein
VGIVTAVQLEPGVYELTDEEYFSSHLASTTLSSTGARRLLDCPAKFRHDQLHGRKGKREFDVGHAAHQLVLGAGPALVYVDAEEWRTKAVKEQVAAIREAGAVPLRPSDWDAVHDMASALLTHPLAPKLFTRGDPERTLIWRDAATGVPCRAKADWLRPDGIVDYKTARTVGSARRWSGTAIASPPTSGRATALTSKTSSCPAGSGPRSTDARIRLPSHPRRGLRR